MRIFDGKAETVKPSHLLDNCFGRSNLGVRGVNYTLSDFPLRLAAASSPPCVACSNTSTAAELLSVSNKAPEESTNR